MVSRIGVWKNFQVGKEREVLSLLAEHVTYDWRDEITRLGKHSCIGSINANSTSSWRASTHHGVQQGRQCAGHLEKPGTRLPGVHPEYSATASGRGSNGYTRHLLSAALTLEQCFRRD
ncbi:hypothetical protein TNCV_2530891 [Trichonephila clavipes]|nr:hypothetical protein TNCV_2530891 [Trichonephila clavipes]